MELIVNCNCLSFQVQNMGAVEWNAMFTYMPSKQVKVAVKDKSLLRCSEDETRLLEPESLQHAIDSIVNEVCPSQGRCFVRPSGTEEVVRIYAEASIEEEVNCIVDRVRQAIIAHCS